MGTAAGPLRPCSARTVSANADGLRHRLASWCNQFVPLALADTVERMRPEAPIAPAGGREVGGSATRGELRRSLRAGPVVSSGDRFVGQFQAPVIQAATTDMGAAPHIIRARKPGGVLVFFSQNAGRTVVVRGKGGAAAAVAHPGNPPRPWILPGLLRHWPNALAQASRQVRP